jgi:hypothetical protein
VLELVCASAGVPVPVPEVIAAKILERRNGFDPGVPAADVVDRMGRRIAAPEIFALTDSMVQTGESDPVNV